jgi:hypothetical protein
MNQKKICQHYRGIISKNKLHGVKKKSSILQGIKIYLPYFKILQNYINGDEKLGEK